MHHPDFLVKNKFYCFKKPSLLFLIGGSRPTSWTFSTSASGIEISSGTSVSSLLPYNAEAVSSSVVSSTCRCVCTFGYKSSYSGGGSSLFSDTFGIIVSYDGGSSKFDWPTSLSASGAASGEFS